MSDLNVNVAGEPAGTSTETEKVQISNGPWQKLATPHAPFSQFSKLWFGCPLSHPVRWWWNEPNNNNNTANSPVLVCRLSHDPVVAEELFL